MPTSTTTFPLNATSSTGKHSRSAAQQRSPNGVKLPPEPPLSETDLHHGETGSRKTDNTLLSTCGVAGSYGLAAERF